MLLTLVASGIAVAEVCLVISKGNLFKGLCDFMGGRPS